MRPSKPKSATGNFLAKTYFFKTIKINYFVIKNFNNQSGYYLNKYSLLVLYYWSFYHVFGYFHTNYFWYLRPSKTFSKHRACEQFFSMKIAREWQNAADPCHKLMLDNSYISIAVVYNLKLPCTVWEYMCHISFFTRKQF